MLYAQVPVRATCFKQIIKPQTPVSKEGEAFIQIDLLRFYISHCYLYRDAQKIGGSTDSIYLIDFEQPKPVQFELDHPNLVPNRLQFCIGVDSISSCLGAYEGALDPLNGMYWSWQSGYINLKLEGTYALNQQKEAFQYHIGGYQYPYNALRTVELDLEAGLEFILCLKVDLLLDLWDWKQTKQLMRPCLSALRFADILAQSFEISYD